MVGWLAPSIRAVSNSANDLEAWARHFGTLGNHRYQHLPPLWLAAGLWWMRSAEVGEHSDRDDQGPYRQRDHNPNGSTRGEVGKLSLVGIFLTTAPWPSFVAH